MKIAERRRYMGAVELASCLVRVYVDGAGDAAVRVLSDAVGFDFGTVASMMVDGVSVAPARTLVFGDTMEHEVTVAFRMVGVPDWAFAGCTAITAVGFDDTVHSVGTGALWGCVGVARVVVDGEVLPAAAATAFGDPLDDTTLCCSAWGADVARVYAPRTAYVGGVTGEWSELRRFATFKPLLKEHPFTVAADKTVRFASGNLQYLGSKEAFCFGKRQHEMVGNGVGNTTAPASRQTQDNLIDLFSWGCSGGQYDGYHRHWKPYDCIYYSSASAYAYYYGIVYGSQNYSYNLAATGADWGVANRFMSERVRTGWRTLTANEWQYLFQTRANATARRAKAKIDGVKGLILLPDDWALPTGVALVTDAAATTNYGSNTFTASEWALLEDAGAIFLPAAGFRAAVSTNSATTTADDYTGTGKPTVGDADHSGNPTGSYWSTTYSGSQAYRFYFANASNTPKSATDRYKGYAVRLVRDY